MTSVVPSGVFNVHHESDPADDIRKSVGDLTGFKLAPGKLLLGVYKRPEKTSGGIIRPNSNQDEDVYQGKTWLVLAAGPLCFQDSDQGSYGGFKAEVGDWVLVRNNDGYRADIGAGEKAKGYECLIVQDRYVKAVVSTPYMVW